MSTLASIHEKFKKTMMFDGETRRKLINLHQHFDISQTDVCVRAINLMHLLQMESSAGKQVLLRRPNGEKVILKFLSDDSYEDEAKVTLKFNAATLAKVDDLAEEYAIYPTYVFRQAIALLNTVHEITSAEFKVLLIDTKNNESETIRIL